ncbi:MAG: hypothetical protein ACSHX3_01885 [Litorimonas sp.]
MSKFLIVIISIINVTGLLIYTFPELFGLSFGSIISISLSVVLIATPYFLVSIRFIGFLENDLQRRRFFKIIWIFVLYLVLSGALILTALMWREQSVLLDNLNAIALTLLVFAIILNIKYSVDLLTFLTQGNEGGVSTLILWVKLIYLPFGVFFLPLRRDLAKPV